MNYDEILLFWVNRLSFLSRRELQSRFAAAGEVIAAEEWAALLMLWQKDGLAPSEIADATTRDRATTTRLLERMEKKGLITRNAGKVDGRRVVVSLTDRGHAIKKVLVPIAMTFVSEVTDSVSQEELAVTMKTLRAMSARITMIDG
ncbi:DNA-binding MarR family transcriptional regulator [Litoreibacter meonggei]|uniref:DNA-binding MarR family transcriptional regulator n=1 Tax=Litoreibacter meonggei TaxID=1049199 RepID=A0A497VLF1_9RHOB|nr:MarR family transcriptional regulator [Litoreibacter meonggei]RLJ41508.1 DNA-binding MarR family transcriptional regulator [Litoreibacter meonggei]